MIVDFVNLRSFDTIQSIVSDALPTSLDEYHLKSFSQDDHLKLVKELTSTIVERHLIWDLLFDNRELLKPILGPDIDTQAMPHLRVSRPQTERDLVSWHRDTFYGNSPWEMNLWFPLFDLHEGAGLMVVPGSHIVPMKNVRTLIESDDFKKGVSKGSLANQVGYTYDAKTDDLISSISQEQVQVIRPRLGSAVLFFGCMAHRAINTSECTRVTIDTRLRDIFTPIDTRPDYYERLCRGPVTTCVQQFLTDRPFGARDGRIETGSH